MKTRWLAGLSIAALTASGSAFAQERVDPPNSDEVIVTAQKREEKLRDVPLSISAMTDDTMQRLGASRFSDASGYIAGLTYQAGTSGAPGEGKLNLRGVTSTSGATTALYIDDVPTTVHGAYGGAGLKAIDLFPYDVERVEVLRGPQGTLYGDSTVGGLVKYVTKSADVTGFSAGAGVEGIGIDGGDGVGFAARGVVNVAVAPGVFGLRVSGFHQEMPGFQTNLTTGKKGTNGIEQNGFRVAARLTPSESFSIDAQWLSTRYSSPDRAMTQLVPGTTKPLYGDYINASPVAQPNSQKFDLGSLTARYDFGPVNLTSVSAYSRAVRAFDADYTFLVRGVVRALSGGTVPNALGIFSNPNATKKYTQELRLASSGDQPLTWVVGGYYTLEKTALQQLTIPLYADGTRITNLPEIYAGEVKAQYTDKSLFANVTYKITDKWDVSGGIRQSWITDKFNNVAQGILIGGQLRDSSRTKNAATTWSLGTRYIASDDLMMFARIATGFRAGSTNTTYPGVPRGYDPDSLIAYEAGVRADFWSKRASIDLTAYYLDWTNLFVTALTPGGFSYTANGGKANGAGMEFTGTLRPVTNLTLTATAAYFGLKIRENLPTINAMSGDRPAYSPPWSGSFLSDYTVSTGGDWQLRLGGGIRWATHSWSDFHSSPAALRIPGYMVADLNAAISNDRWTLRAYVRNLTNEHKLASIGLDNRGILMVPRTVGVALDVKF